MAQGITIKGKTASGQLVEVRVDNDGIVQISGAITVEPTVGSATEAEQEAQTALLTTIESNQLPDGHNVTVDNHPTEFPLPASQVTTLTPPAAITGYATETTLGSRLSEADFDTKTGSLTETAPGTDTASSGLNGRLQRIAQRLTSIIALLPGSLGQKARAASLAVTLSSEDITVLTPPAAITGFATASNQTTLINQTAPTTGLNTGRKTVTTAGTAVALASSTTCKWVAITAETDNTGIVVVGDSGVIATLATREGIPLSAGDTVVIPIDNLNDIFIDATVNTEGVTFLYGT